MYTVEDLERARADLASAERRLDDYDGNNPNKHRTQVAEAREHLYMVERALKRARLIPLTPHDELELALDEKYPGAGNKTTVEHEGKRYIKTFRPGATSLSGGVRFWIESWTEAS
ncbi:MULTISPECIES: hypothetical protein [Burkholderia cepacia complex]|uniref:Bacteriophage protein n=1 Tax=Burkholderia multivorans TaxID=87883 RepID=A0AB37AR58_9BURK|nr:MULTISPECIES: hypothetical protein [Burkholderia cepacia complex]MBU9486696.1 hypothetical protein [Burkholderia multivorans]MBU9546852.1 hypothetical protein [Burkholderia multivorans]MBY4754901.1 hypothetical protein [Burkholderia dolosa]PRE39234.1 hypothetical protein C6P97_31390 [Burkholderia multivorans]PRE47072.1 hypothetical protein C6P99_16055 [Burkholderia multivorans]